MGAKSDYLIQLAGIDFNALSEDEIKSIYQKMLESKLHGICFSPYNDDLKPGDQVTEDQIRKRLEFLKPYTNWVRVFSCAEGNEEIPRIAKEMGFKTLVGAWLGKEHDKNKIEIENLKKIAREGYVDIAAVGNEVMYRKDLSEDELLIHIYDVRQALPNIPVGYVDAYYEFAKRPRITEACTVILANCYPFWEGCDIDYSLLYMKEMYYKAAIAGNGKNVIITETGWPNVGTAFGGSVPSDANAVKYFLNANKWAAEDGIEMFYFSAFDEAWKVKDEGDVGAYWGIWDKDGNPKYY